VAPSQNQSPETAAPSKKQVQDAERWLSNLSPESAQRLLQSWRAGQDEEATFSAVFYQRLFDAHPDVVNLFSGDMERQQQRLTNTLTEAVDLVPEPGNLLLLLRAAGVRHHHYHVQQDHYQMMAPSLMDTFREFLGDEFSAAHEADWLRFFDCMSIVMRDAMAHATDE